jgi:hypothetical protein
VIRIATTLERQSTDARGIVAMGYLLPLTSGTARLGHTPRVTTIVSRDQVLRYRARVMHLDRKLPVGSYAAAAWGGLQDSIPRSGVLSLHARVEGTLPASWEDPSVAQVWFRGSDYVVPRADAAIFTLGSSPRDPDRLQQLDRLADEVHRVTGGRTTTVREVTERLGLPHPTNLRDLTFTGRVHIRWNASQIWIVPVDLPEIDAEDARRELARRHLRWFGPTNVARLARWTGVETRDAALTWASIEGELEPVDVDGEGVDGEGGRRFMLCADVDALLAAEPIVGVRLLPYDDAHTKLDRELLVPDPVLRARVLPLVGQSTLGYTPGAILVDGEIVGAWQRQQRRVRIHPWSKPSAVVREAIDAEALAFPIAGSSKPSVAWD